MADFAAQLTQFARKTGETLADVDRAFKLGILGRVVRNTRVADPASWKRPDPTYLGGTMRGNWQVTTGAPAQTFLQGTRNTSANVPPEEAAKIQPFSSTWLTNNTPYILVYEELDGMASRAVADAKRALMEAINDS